MKISKTARHIQKEALAKWKQLLMAAQKSPETLAKLRTLVNIPKELAGLQKGNVELAKVFNVIEKPGVKRWLTKKLLPGAFLKPESFPVLKGLKNLQSFLKSPQKIKKQFIEGSPLEKLVPSVGKMTTQEKDILKTLIKRHELDEARALMKMTPELAKELTPIIQKSDVLKKQLVTQLKSLKLKEIPDTIKELIGTQGVGLGAVGMRYGKPQLASHLSPEVISREAGLMSLFDPKIRKVFTSPVDFKKSLIGRLNSKLQKVIGVPTPKTLRTLEDEFFKNTYRVPYEQAHSVLPKTKKFFKSKKDPFFDTGASQVESNLKSLQDEVLKKINK